MDFNQLRVGNFVAELNDKQEWIYKAATNTPFKKNGNLRAIYHDLPRYPVIVAYEDQEEKDFNESLVQSIKDISLKLLSFNH